MKIQKPKILQCISHFSMGGAEEVALSIVKGLNQEFDFFVFAVSDLPANPVGDRMKAVLDSFGVSYECGSRMPIKRGGAFLASMKIRKVIGDFQPDLIHLHTEIPELCYSLYRTAIRESPRIPVLRTIHNAKFWHSWRFVGACCAKVLKDSGIVTVSDGAQREYIRYLKGNSLPGPPFLDRIYNGVDCFEVQLSSPKRMGKLRGLFAGRFEVQKGADLLPFILEECNQATEIKFDLDIIGSGTYTPVLETLEKHSNGAIRVSDPVPDLKRILPDYDFLIMPSRFEGLGLVAVEAILNGVIVIATDSEGLLEALPENYPWRAKSGSAKSFAETLTDALIHREKWSAILEEAQDFCLRRFSIEAMSNRYSEVYIKGIQRWK